VGTADGTLRTRRPRRARPWITAVTGVLVAGALGVASLDLTGRLPGGLVTDRPTPALSTARPLDPDPVAAPDVLAAQPASSAPAVPVAALDAVLTSGALGPGPGALVLDVESAAALLDRSGDVPRIPASVAKLVTGAAALVTLDVGSRLSTRVVRGATPGEVVLVGGGDTTLTTRPGPGGGYPARASLAELADSTAATLLAAGTGEVVVRVDAGLFEGPSVSPDWRPTYVAAGVVAPVSALSVDTGRVSPHSVAREPDPALAAGRALVRLLSRRGVTVSDEVTRTPAPPGADEIAAVSSATVGELVELMLTTSDNDLAESVLRLVAVAAGRPGTFTDGSAVAVQVLLDLGVPTDGLVLLDGSGLARGSTIAPETLARLLVTAADGSRPELGHLLGGLPVAGFSGTLSLRFGAGRPGTAAGLVRAKSGTLTGVSTLAGIAPVAGRPVVFVVMADSGTADALTARDALDGFAATLVGVGRTAG